MGLVPYIFTDTMIDCLVLTRYLLYETLISGVLICIEGSTLFYAFLHHAPKQHATDSLC